MPHTIAIKIISKKINIFSILPVCLNEKPSFPSGDSGCLWQGPFVVSAKLRQPQTSKETIVLNTEHKWWLICSLSILVKFWLHLSLYSVLKNHLVCRFLGFRVFFFFKCCLIFVSHQEKLNPMMMWLYQVPDITSRKTLSCKRSRYLLWLKGISFPEQDQIFLPHTCIIFYSTTQKAMKWKRMMLNKQTNEFSRKRICPTDVPCHIRISKPCKDLPRSVDDTCPRLTWAARWPSQMSHTVAGTGTGSRQGGISR